MPVLHSEPDRDRRNFLKFRPSAKTQPVRPPWTDETRVAAACLRCGDCVSACPEKVLRAGDGGFPEVQIRTGGSRCTFCGHCAEVCPAAVFDLSRDPVWQVSVELENSACLARLGVHCESCRDSCPESAITFRPRIGGPAVPQIEDASCTGCGACVGICPVHAINQTHRSGGEVTG